MIFAPFFSIFQKTMQKTKTKSSAKSSALSLFDHLEKILAKAKHVERIHKKKHPKRFATKQTADGMLFKIPGKVSRVKPKFFFRKRMRPAGQMPIVARIDFLWLPTGEHSFGVDFASFANVLEDEEVSHSRMFFGHGP